MLTEQAQGYRFMESLPKGNETILLVDDEELVIDIGQRMMEMLGYTVIVARSGQQAVETFKEEPERFFLVILDMIMPEMDGGQTYARLQEIQPDVRVVLTSGYGLDTQTQEVIDKGCKGFLKKPFNLEQLSKTLREVLDMP